MKVLSYCDRVIRYSFYALFFFVPLVLTNNTSELFEFNKMWVTFALTIVIVSAWIVKMIVSREIRIQRTFLDIPLLLFLLAHIISTLFSIDRHVSLWGYYSRFNGGLLSILSYILLYYAFVSNLTAKSVIRVLTVSILTGIIVALWGLPSHFGKDPTCLIFRGTLNTSCWTEAFKPEIRIFSTLGQPAWLAAYLAILLPISMMYSILIPLSSKKEGKPTGISDMSSSEQTATNIIPFIGSTTGQVIFTFLTALFYANLLFTSTRAGFIAFWIANAVFWIILFIKYLSSRGSIAKYFLLINSILLITTFFLGTPIGALNNFSYPSLKSKFAANKTSEAKPTPPTPAEPQESGITDSGKIRLYVWQGAIDAWKARPLFGYGVETFAFAYYLHRPADHNTTTEWDYLYNKAHNEYLNYLTTTGIFGLGSYLLFIGLFLIAMKKYLLYRIDAIRPLIPTFFKRFPPQQAIDDERTFFVILALTVGFITILITNFFGFSVVIGNVYFFLIPAMIMLLGGMLDANKVFRLGSSKATTTRGTTVWDLSGMLVILTIALYLLLMLYQYWQADKTYAVGSNLNRVSEYQQAYPYLQDAIDRRPNEPIFKSEFSVTNAAIASALIEQSDATNAAQLANRAVQLSNDVVSSQPNNIVFWKDRVRVFYALGQSDPRYLQQAFEAMQKTVMLAPTDAKVRYNLGIMLGQAGQFEKAIAIMNETIRLKSNYVDAYYARALFYRELATNTQGVVVDTDVNQKAIDSLQYILQKFGQNNKEVRDTLEKWK